MRQLIAKCVTHAAGAEAKNACDTDQLYAGLEAGIEGGMHDIDMEWELREQDEDWGFLLVDARNAFDKLIRKQMPWSARHLWPSGARFTFNCCRHHATLMMQNGNDTALIIFSRKGISQGDPLSRLICGIGILPMVKELKRSVPKAKHS